MLTANQDESRPRLRTRDRLSMLITAMPDHRNHSSNANEPADTAGAPSGSGERLQPSREAQTSQVRGRRLTALQEIWMSASGLSKEDDSSTGEFGREDGVEEDLAKAAEVLIGGMGIKAGTRAGAAPCPSPGRAPARPPMSIEIFASQQASRQGSFRREGSDGGGEGEPRNGAPRGWLQAVPAGKSGAGKGGAGPAAPRGGLLSRGAEVAAATSATATDMYIRARKLSRSDRATIQRLELVIDLKDSEKKYLSDLTEGRRAFFGKLQPLLSEEQSRTLFEPLARFPAAHEYLFNVFQAKVRSFKPAAPFVEVFKLWASNLKMYASYGAERKAAVALMESLATPPPTKSFTKALKHSKILPVLNSCVVGEAVGAPAYLSCLQLPLQRLQYYVGFLSQYFALVDREHPDYPLLPDLIDQLSAVEKAIGDTKWVQKGMLSTNSALLHESYLLPEGPASGDSSHHQDLSSEATRCSVTVDPEIIAWLLATPHKIRVQPDLEFSHEDECAKSICAEFSDDELIMRKPFDRFEVQYATVNRLIHLLTTPPLSDRVQSQRFTLVFFRTYSTFCSPDLLLRKLEERFHGTELPDIQCYVLKVISYWINFDFASVPSRIADFLEALNVRKASLSPKLVPVLVFLTKTYQRKLVVSPITTTTTTTTTTISSSSSSFSSPIIDPSSTFPSSLQQPQFSADNFLFLMTPLELAQQLCLIDHSTYSTVVINELLGLSWQGKEAVNRAPNLTRVIGRLNKIASLCSYAVVTGASVSARKHALSLICAVMKHLLELQNFASLVAFSSSLQESSVFRMKKTFAALSPKKHQLIAQVKALFDSSSNYKVFRCLYQGCHSPCVPFIGIFLTDLTFTEEGNKDFTKGLVNFHKMMLLSDIISITLAHQSSPYKFPPNHAFTSWLESQPDIPPQTLYTISLVAEPRGSTVKV